MRHSLAALHLLYAFGDRETSLLRSSNRTARVVAISALALTLGVALSACGRRGPLEMPPSVAMTPQGPVEFDREGRPIAPPGPKRRLPIDALLD